jgi:abelson tyrosine-protein kinase 1
VIGTLDAPDYALFVSHNHPDGQVHFNIYSSQRGGQAWGMFTTDTEHPNVVGPDYDEGIPGTPVSASKVSRVGRQGSWDTVLLARLRFKPDVPEPTSL